MVFSDRTQVEIVERLSENDSQILINMVDEVLDSLQPEIRRKCVHCLVRICGSRALLPKSLQIPLRYDSTKPAHYDDGFVSVWKGQHNGLEVTAKVLKVYPRTDLECIRRRFCREVIIRRCLCHSNVLPLLGVTMNGNQFVMVSEWMDDGNINEFLKKNTNVNRLELLREVTRGLVYMHDQGVIHGNLNGYNILINKSGHACLSGFDLVSIVSDQSTETLSMMERDITPWMSPELIGHEGARRPTIESDCYALGMVIYEVLSGQVPFNTCTPLVIFMRVLGGERPKRPQGEGGKLFTDGIWKLLELCWKHQPSDRASAKDVLRYLEEIPSLPCPSSNMDVDVGTDSDYQSDCALLVCFLRFILGSSLTILVL
ncbi:kinase-like protein [Thelephora ganbajun]|uniref:Kinase-like protein n=1 Tax=Thelephora ganbajun TaxID=370292 RepID=A0ACB6Z393_THEGA|nr:kinase-like protein [Thelephora ganbajun]